MEESICIGDYVTFKTPKPNDGWLGFEGILGSECFITSDGGIFDNCIWQVIPKNQYSAVQEYISTFNQRYESVSSRIPTDALESFESRDVKNVHYRRKVLKEFDSKTNDLLVQLHKAAVNEIRLNEKLMAVKMGRPIAFGDVIQLRHVKSGRFLTVSPKDLARFEKENMQVTLHERGESMSYMSLSPRYKIEKEGQKILNNSEVFIRVVERPDEYIHAAKNFKKLSDKASIGEINCSLDSTSWVVSVYHKHDQLKSGMILAGSIITLQDLDFMVMMGNLSYLNSIFPSEESSVVVPETEKVVVHTSSGNRNIEGLENIDVNDLWVIEKFAFEVGGPILFTDLITLKNLTSGLFLKVEDGKVSGVKSREKSSKFNITSPLRDVKVGAMQEYRELLNGHGIYLTTGELYASYAQMSPAPAASPPSDLTTNAGAAGNAGTAAGTAAGTVGGSGEKTRSSANLKYIVFPSKAKNWQQRAVQFVVNTDIQRRIGMDLYIGAETVQFLNNFLISAKQLSPPNGMNPSNEIKTNVAMRMKSLFSFLDNVNNYLTVYKSDKVGSYDKYDEELKTFTPSNIIKRRQFIFQTQGAIDVLLDLVHFTTNNALDKCRLNMRRSLLSEKKKSGLEKSMSDIASQLDADIQLSARLSSRKDKAVSSGNSLSNLLGLVSDSPTPRKRGGGLGVSYVGDSILGSGRIHTDRTADKESSGSNNYNSGLLSGRSRNPAGAKVAVTSSSGGESSSGSSSHRLPLRRAASISKKLILLDGDLETASSAESESGALKIINASSPSDDVSNACLRVLRSILRNNASTRTHTANRMQVLIQQVPKHYLAVSCVQEILEENAILSTSVQEKYINMFLDLLLLQRMNGEYMSLLNKTCRAGAKGVDNTQRLVASSLFRHLDFNELFFTKSEQNSEETIKYKPIIITFLSDNNTLYECDWTGFGLYCPLNLEMALESVNSYELVCEGLPQVYVSWTDIDEHSDYNMRSLFGQTDMIPLELLCSITSHTDPSFDSLSMENSTGSDKYSRSAAKKALKAGGVGGTKSVVERKREVLEYVVAQLNLLADLCLDRNYVSINLIENAVPYEVLVAILKNESIPNFVKAPACRLIRCLYLDREPQVKVKYPRLLRNSNSVKGNGDYDSYDSKRSENNLYSFGLLQIIVSEYIHRSLNTSDFDECTCEMTKTIDALFEFGYYSNEKQIADIRGPLIECLDRHIRTKSKNQNQKSSEDHLLQLGHMSLNSNSDDGEKGEKSVDEDASWQYKHLIFTESIQYLFMILAVVLTAVSVAIVQLYMANPGSSADFKIVDYTVSIFFFAELFMRVYCTFAVNRSIFGFFFGDLFNLLDLILVTLDITLIVIGAQLSIVNSGRLVRLFRVIRLLRLLRIIRAAKLAQIVAAKNRAKSMWVLPARFTEATSFEIETKINILSIFSQVYDRIHDKKLEYLIKIFLLWCEEESLGKFTDPLEFYGNHTMKSDESSSESLPANFDDILLDIMMYSDTNLCTEALQLLMIHKSGKEIMVQLSSQVQIIYSSKMESISLQITESLKEIMKLGEMYEIWCSLNKSEHLESASRFSKLVENIIDLIRKPNDDRTLNIRCEYYQDEDVQKILFNLDFVGVIMYCLGVFQSGGGADFDNPKMAKVIDIMKRSVVLFYWYVKDCPQNQQSAVNSLDWLIDRIDDAPQMRTSQLVREILKGNRNVAKQFQWRQHIADFAKKIVTLGHRPEFLDLFLGLVEQNAATSDGTSNDISIENEVVKYLTGREYKNHIMLWCCTNNSPAYNQRVETMRKFKATYGDDVLNEYDLPSDLNYHVSLLTTLSNCNLGPKLKALYGIDDIVPAIVHPDTIFLVKIGLSNILLEIIKSDAEHLQCSESVWNFFSYVIDDIDRISKTLGPHIKKPTSSPSVRVLHGKWLEVVFNIVYNFFEYFDFNHFNPDQMVNEELNIRITSHSPTTIMQMIIRLTENMIEMQEAFGYNLGGNILELLDLTIDTTVEASGQQQKVRNRIEDSKVRAARSANKRHLGISFTEQQQLHYRKQFAYFVNKVYSNVSATDDAVSLFEKLPRGSDNVSSDVRIEPLLYKIAGYLRSNMTVVGNMKSFNIEIVDITLWLLRTFRQMLENCSCYRIDSDGLLDKNETSPNKISDKFSNIFSDYSLGDSIVNICLDFLAIGISHDISIEALRFLTIILAKDGGCSFVQDEIHKRLVDNDTLIFFEFLKETIQNIHVWVEKLVENKSNHRDKKELGIPPSMIVFNFLQYLCEGESLYLRDFIRENGSDARHVDLFSNIADLLNLLSRDENGICTFVSIQILRTCQKLMAGPCPGNQENFVIQTELLVSINRFIKKKDVSTTDILISREIEKLKEVTVSVLSACIEGNPPTSVVFEKVSTTVEFNVFSMILLPNELDLQNQKADDATNNFQLSKVQQQYLVFMHTLGPNFINMLPPLSLHIAEEKVKSIEVLWKGEVHQVSFHIPSMAEDISEKSISSILDQNNHDEEYETQESKLIKFMDKSRTLFKEAEHQRYLFQFYISNMINDTTRFYATWLMFINAVVMNILILCYFGTRPYEDDDHAHSGHRNLAAGGGGGQTYPKPITEYIYMTPHIADTITILNVVQSVLVAIVLLIYYVGAMPVFFSRHEEKGNNFVNSLILTLLDPLPVWYIGYFIITIYALKTKNMLWLSALLLDWILLDSTTRDVLRAIQNPAKQLGATLIIILIMLNIFAGITFYFYRQDLVELTVINMWDSFKLNLAYGIRGEYGVAHEMYNSLGPRMVFDIFFYFIILAILRQIFFAVIVDTFGKMREVKLEIEQRKNNTCFICGVEKADIDKINTSNAAFNEFVHHKTVVHDPYLYLCFMIYVWNRPLDEDSGIEMFVRKCISNTRYDTSWLPVGVYSRGDSQVLKHLHGEDDDGFSSVLKRSESVSSDIKSNKSRGAFSDKLNQIEKLLSDNRMATNATTSTKSGSAELLIESPTSRAGGSGGVVAVVVGGGGGSSSRHSPETRVRGFSSAGDDIEDQTDNDVKGGGSKGKGKLHVGKVKEDLGSILENLNQLHQQVNDLKLNHAKDATTLLTPLPSEPPILLRGRDTPTLPERRKISNVSGTTPSNNTADNNNNNSGINVEALVAEERAKFESKIAELEKKLESKKDEETKLKEELERQFHLKLSKAEAKLADAEAKISVVEKEKNDIAEDREKERERVREQDRMKAELAESFLLSKPSVQDAFERKPVEQQLQSNNNNNNNNNNSSNLSSIAPSVGNVWDSYEDYRKATSSKGLLSRAIDRSGGESAPLRLQQRPKSAFNSSSSSPFNIDSSAVVGGASGGGNNKTINGSLSNSNSNSPLDHRYYRVEKKDPDDKDIDDPFSSGGDAGGAEGGGGIQGPYIPNNLLGNFYNSLTSKKNDDKK